MISPLSPVASPAEVSVTSAGLPTIGTPIKELDVDGSSSEMIESRVEESGMPPAPIGPVAGDTGRPFVDGVWTLDVSGTVGTVGKLLTGLEKSPVLDPRSMLNSEPLLALAFTVLSLLPVEGVVGIESASSPIAPPAFAPRPRMLAALGPLEIDDAVEGASDDEASEFEICPVPRVGAS